MKLPANASAPGEFVTPETIKRWTNLRVESPGRLAANLGLLALWLWLYRSVYSYLAIIFSRQEFRTNQILLLGILVLLVVQVRARSLGLRLDRWPQRYPPAIALTLGGSALFVLVEHYLDVNTLSASLFGLASYGLLGLWLHPDRWRRGLPAALLLLGTLPFGEHLQTFVGYPLRRMTAAVVGAGLARLGVPSVGVDTILVFETGISQVDLPCSGVRSLWTGGLFLLAATWIERRPLNRRWLAVALGFALLLMTANLARVAVLVTVGEVAGWRLLAEMLHVPLGVLGFMGACAAALAMLRWVGGPAPSATLPAPGPGSSSPSRGVGARAFLPRSGRLVLILAAALLALSLLYTPRPPATGLPPALSWAFPAPMQVTPWPLTPGEARWLSTSGALAGDRFRFRWHGRQGSILLVTGTSWRAHHRPERCFEVYGLTVESARTALAGPDFPLQLLLLGDGKGSGLYTAAYWFQSADLVTEDYATRIWADLAPRRRPWVLVTVLLDDPRPPLDDDMQSFFGGLRQVVARSLEDISNE